MIERTLILIKTDGVQRALVGRIVQRFEDAGFKIVGMKMVWINQEFAKKHYFDVAQRHGEKVLKFLVDGITEGPVIAMVLEGVHAIANARKLVGPTYPDQALPGTIRGDFAMVSKDYGNTNEKVVKNLVHASAKKEDAEIEINLWFKKEELHTYKTVHEVHTF